MEDIITQRFSYASITPYKDYCRLDEKKDLSTSFQNNLDGLSEVDELLSFLSSTNKEKTNSKYVGRIVSLPEKRKRKVHYFSTTDTVQERFEITYAYKNSKRSNTFETTNNRHIKSHYGRPFSSISVSIIERSIRKRGDIVTIKVYVSSKNRSFNSIYFRKSFTVYSLSINLKTGNFTTGTITKSGKKSGKTFRVNNFMELSRIVTGKSFLNVHGFISSDSVLKNEFIEIFDNLEFTTQIQKVLGIDLGCVSYSSNPNQFVSDLCKIFIKKKNIKVPNGDYEFWISRYYPTEKYLKKNDRKLIASILDVFNIKTKFTIKLLHEYPSIDLFGLISFCSYFGNDYSKYISSLQPHVFENSVRKVKNDDYVNNKSFILNNVTKSSYHLTDNEKENLIRVANSIQYSSDGVFSERMIQLFNDHFKMIEKVRDYDSSLFMKSKTIDEFNDEHRELTKMVSAIKKGWVIEYQFNEKMVEDIEKPIPLKINLGSEENPVYADDIDISFYPYILKREEEYIEEGSFMHHCVATYADKDKSIIISVRTENSMDRVTCEYNCQDGRLIQSRHFCNKQPPADMEYAIEDLTIKVQKYARLGLLHNTDKKKVPLKINGVEVVRENPTSWMDAVFGAAREF